MFGSLNDPFSDFSTPSPQTTESPCEGVALAIAILAPSLKIPPFSDLSPGKRHLALHRRWPFLVTPPSPGVLIWAGPSHRVVSKKQLLHPAEQAALAAPRHGPRKGCERMSATFSQTWHCPWPTAPSLAPICKQLFPTAALPQTQLTRSSCLRILLCRRKTSNFGNNSIFFIIFFF